jgi:hypothetical protein
VVERGASKTAGSEFGDCHALERLSPVGFDVPPAAPWSLAIRKSESVAGPKAQAPNAFARRGMGRAFSPRAFVIINLGRWPRLVWSRAFGPVDARNANMDQFTPAASSAEGADWPNSSVQPGRPHHNLAASHLPLCRTRKSITGFGQQSASRQGCSREEIGSPVVSLVPRSTTG